MQQNDAETTNATVHFDQLYSPRGRQIQRNDFADRL